MSLIDSLRREENELYRFACENAGNEYLDRDWKEEREGFYQDYTCKECIYEYGFDSLYELEDKLELLWKDKNYAEKLAKMYSVAAYRRKPDIQEETIDTSRSDFELPEFIYTF